MPQYVLSDGTLIEAGSVAEAITEDELEEIDKARGKSKQAFNKALAKYNAEVVQPTAPGDASDAVMEPHIAITPEEYDRLRRAAGEL